MRIQTVPLAEPPPLLDHDPSLVWISEDTTLIGHGEALRVAAGFGPGRFRVAEAAFAEWTDGQEVDDRVGVPGSGPVAFGSFTFDERSAGSVLVVPEVTIGKSAGRWFVTTVGAVDPARLLEPAPWSTSIVDRPSIRRGFDPRHHLGGSGCGGDRAHPLRSSAEGGDGS